MKREDHCSADILTIVDECIRRYSCGEYFFEAIDSRCRSYVVSRILLKSIPLDFLDHRVVVSGQFGRYLFGAFPEVARHGVLMPGGLRDISPRVLFKGLGPIVGNNMFVFLDDSYYSGKTSEAIGKALEANGGRLDHTFVVYDGSRKQNNSVTGLFRYHQ